MMVKSPRQERYMMFETDDKELEQQINEQLEGDDDESTENQETEENQEAAPEGKEQTGKEQVSEEELDWSKFDPRAKKVYEESVKKAQHWEKTHNRLQSQNHQLSKANKHFESTQKQYQEANEQLQQWNRVLQENPRLLQVLKAEMQRSQNPLAADLPDHVKQDPVYQYVSNQMAPMIENLQAKIAQLEGKANQFDQFSSKETERENRAKLDGLIDDSKNEIKRIFGSDATEEQVEQVLQFMVDNKYYHSGKAAAMAVFGDQYEGAIKTRLENEMKEKAKKFGSKNKSLNPSRVGTQTDAVDLDEAVKMAMAEQGF